MLTFSGRIEILTINIYFIPSLFLYPDLSTGYLVLHEGNSFFHIGRAFMDCVTETHLVLVILYMSQIKYTFYKVVFKLGDNPWLAAIFDLLLKQYSSAVDQTFVLNYYRTS